MGFMSIALTLCLAVPDLKPAEAMVADLGWMAGSWSCEKWGGTFEEHWLAPSGGTMLGVGKHRSDTKTDFMEFLTLEPSGKGVTMWIMLGSPSKGPKNGVPFVLTSLEKGVAVFENPKNDFPSKITYWKPVDGSMRCVIEGMQNGKAASEEFPFRKVR